MFTCDVSGDGVVVNCVFIVENVDNRPFWLRMSPLTLEIDRLLRTVADSAFCTDRAARYNSDVCVNWSRIFLAELQKCFAALIYKALFSDSDASSAAL